MPFRQLLLCGMCAVLTGCNPPPGLEAGARIPKSDKVVTLLPLDDLLAEANAGAGAATDASAAALAARAAQLRARAAAN
jgi:hypothetical protein